MQSSVRAQSGTSWNFDTGLQGWTANPMWAADNIPTSGVNGPAIAPATTPPTPPVGPPPGISSGTAYSPPNSLNFNNASGIYSGTAIGSAFSPTISLTAPENFGWRCAYETENTDDDGTGTSADFMSFYDRRIVRVHQGSSTGPVVFEQQYIPLGGTNPPTYTPLPLNGTQQCNQMGEWHTHFFQLDPAWSPMVIEFQFNSIDAAFNDHTGWFIDDAAVGASSGGGGPGGSGPGGAGRQNANGDESGNDLFGENWCGSGSSFAGSSLGLAVTLAVLAFALSGRR
jgi:hypothetical protein